MVFVSIVLAVLALMHVYVYLRSVHAVFAGSRARRAGAAVLVALGLVVVAAFVTRRTPGMPAAVPYVGMVWLGVLLYLVLPGAAARDR